MTCRQAIGIPFSCLSICAFDSFVDFRIIDSVCLFFYKLNHFSRIEYTHFEVENIPRRRVYVFLKWKFLVIMNVLEVLRRLDAYPKTLEEFSQKTICGAAVTLVSSVIMIWLLVFEFYAYLTPNITEELFVDTTRSHKLKINLELYIPTISCNCKQKIVQHLLRFWLNSKMFDVCN